MIYFEVNCMDEIHDNELNTSEEETGYVPRPAWQVWSARIGLVFFILFVIYQIMSIANGGLS